MNEPYNEGEEREFQIPLSDLFKIFRRNARKIFLGALVFSFLFGGYSLIRPVQYEAEATFKEKGSSGTNVGSSSIAEMFLSKLNGGGKSEARTIMKSRKLLQKVIKPLGLQAALGKKTENSPWLQVIQDNCKVAYNYFMNDIKHPLPDVQSAIIARNIEYPGELPLTLKLQFESDERFTVFDKEGEKLGEGSLGIPYTTREYSFTIYRTEKSDMTDAVYYLTLLPLYDVASGLSKQISILPDKDDSSLLKISYRDRDRQLACTLVNQLMYSYQDYLKAEQKRVSAEQISYLDGREKEIGNNLKEKIEDYAQKLSSEASTLGYTDSQKAMEFLTGQIQEFRKKNLRIDLELERLTRLKHEDPDTQIDAQYQSDTNPSSISRMIDQICDLKQQSDGLELAVRGVPSPHLNQGPNSFQSQIAEIDNLRRKSSDAARILGDLEKRVYPLPKLPLSENPDYMVREWYSQIQELEDSWYSAPQSDKEWIGKQQEQYREHFISYLTNLVHFLEVSEKAAQERLSHQQSPRMEFQGIDLQTASGLYVDYCKQLNGIEAQILQCNYLVDELKDPNFEISSLSSVNNDTVTEKLVQNASGLVLALQDDVNRSMKEKERMKKELDIQRRFLDMHLKQTVNLLKLREDLLKSKIYSLQHASLELVQRQISILEKKLVDSLGTHYRNLEEEKKLIALHQAQLRKEMSTLPQKWASEKLIEHQLRLNTAMVEELTKLVESTNIASNLDRIQSAPMDLAIPPIKPIKPKVFFFALVGALFGAFITSLTLFVRTIGQGLPTSRESLMLQGLHVSGTLTKYKASNSDTLARLAAFIGHPTTKSRGSSLLIISGRGYDCSHQLGTILEKGKETVLMMDLSIPRTSGSDSIPGLIQYLKGDISEPPIVNKGNFDWLSMGNGEANIAESLCSRKYIDFLSDLKKKYNWIIATSSSNPESVEVEQLLGLFDYAAINISGETLNQLSPLIKTLRKSGNNETTSFLISEEK